MDIRISFFQWIVRQLRNYWGLYLGGVICLICLFLVQRHIPFLAKKFISMEALEGKNLPLIQLLGIAASIVVLRTLSRLFFFYPARVQQKDLRLKLLHTLEKSHPENYEDRTSGEIYQIFINDCDYLRGFVGFGFLQFCNFTIALIVFLPSIGQLHPMLLYSLGPIVLIMLALIFIMLKLHSLLKYEMKYQQEAQSLIIESFLGKSTIESFQSEDSFMDKFIKKTKQEMNILLKVGFTRSLYTPLTRLGIGISFIAGALIIHHNHLHLDALIIYSGFLFLILEPLTFMSWIGVVTALGLASWQRIKDFYHCIDKNLKQKKDVSLENNILRKKINGAEICFDLKIPDWTVICGETGCGKSTLLGQLATDLKKQKMSFALVEQLPYIFEDSFKKNVFLENYYLTDNRVQELIKILGLKEISSKNSNIMDVILGRNKRIVSGGQQKRIAILRSLLSDADIILWDDVFSSIDNEQEIFMMKRIKKIFLNKKVILTTHRPTTLYYSDNYVLLKKVGAPVVGLSRDVKIPTTEVGKFFKDIKAL